MSSNAEQELLLAMLTDNLVQPELTPVLQDTSMPDGHSARRKRKRQLPSGSMHDCQQQVCCATQLNIPHRWYQPLLLV